MSSSLDISPVHAPTDSRPVVPSGAGSPARPRRKRRVDPTFYLFLIPTLLVFTLAVTVPAVMGIVYSFTNSIGFGDFEFVGLNNYLALFSDPSILSAYAFTLGFSLVTVLLVNALSLALAIGLTAKIKFKAALRAVYVVPMVVSGIIIAYVFQFLFYNSLPALGEALGSKVLSASILTNPDLAWTGIVVVTAWQAIPSSMLVFMAGLLAIPGDIYEAASIDGASAWQRFRGITLPLIAGYLMINTIIGFKNFLNAYDIIVGLTAGGPGTATYSIAMRIFSGFDGGDYAYQMANATVFFAIAVVLALLQLRLTRGKAAL